MSAADPTEAQLGRLVDAIFAHPSTPLPPGPYVSRRDTHVCARCGHQRIGHTHYRAGTDCGACDCPAFRALWQRNAEQLAAAATWLTIGIAAASLVGFAIYGFLCATGVAR